MKSTNHVNLKKLKQKLKKSVKGKPTYHAQVGSPMYLLSESAWVGVKIISLIIILSIILVGSLGLGVVVGYVSTTKDLPSDLLHSGTQTTYVYDSEGGEMAKLTGANNIDRRYVPFNDVKDTYIDDAFIAIEDERFVTNIGIDPKRILSAIASALANGGEATHGGSTITQQTVKLITGENQRSAQRKIQEWYNAIKLNQKLTKWEIMELYLNLVPMSNSYVGIETAAESYFGKPASKLTLPECAYLAGIPKSPAAYNPLTERGRRNGMRRQRIVLNKMYQLGKITESELNDALNAELIFKDNALTDRSTHVNSYFTEYAVQEVIKDLQVRNGLSEDLARQIVNSGGLKIYTTMEPTVQNALDETFKKRDLFMAAYDRVVNLPEKPEAGMAVINNKTSGIAGLQGGYGKKKANLVLNRATDIKRQPGSCTKPINIYAPGIEMYKVTGATILDDKKVFLNPDDPTEPYPKNAYYPRYRGKMTLRNALKISNNVPAAEVLQMIGIKNSKYYMNEVGIDRIKDPAGIAIATGSYGTGMSPLEIATAFTVFPNGGKFSPSYSYSKVEDSNGNILLENKQELKQVYRPSVAYMMTRIMEETILPRTSNFPYPGSASGFGMIKNGNGSTIDTAGKTGTTDEDVDKWFSAFTPYYTGAVWYGYDNRIKKQSVIQPDDQGAKRIWFDAMRQIHKDKAIAKWIRPKNIIERRICIQSGQLATPYCGGGNTITEYFEADSPLTPSIGCQVHTYSPPTIETEAPTEESPADNQPAATSPTPATTKQTAPAPTTTKAPTTIAPTEAP